MPNQIVTDFTKKQHMIFQQEEANSCGLACAAMMIYRVKNQQVVTEATLKQEAKCEYNAEAGMFLHSVEPLLKSRDIKWV